MQDNFNISNLLLQSDGLTFEQIVTYIVAPLIAAAAAIWALVKVIIPRIIEARLEGEKDHREYSQKSASLEQLSRLSDSAAAHQVVAELLANSQDNEREANEFIRTIVFKGIQDISRRLAQLENRQSLLSNLITGGKLVEENEPVGDYDTWRRARQDGIPQQSPIIPNREGGNEK